MKQVLILGGVSYNIMVDVNQFPPPSPQSIQANSYHEAVGSTGAGKALALNKVKVDLTLQGIIGDDYYGGLIINKFNQEGISFSYDLDSDGTQRHVNLMNPEGERLSIFLHAPPADIELDLNRIERLIKESELVIPNIAPHCKRFIPLLEKYQPEVWYDLHGYDGEDDYYDEFIAAADVIFFSSEEVNSYRPIMKQLLNRGARLIVCTHGSQGATALSVDEGWIEVSAVDYPVVDTNGAGDNFFAGVLYGYLHDYSLLKSLRLGTIMGGLAVTNQELTAPGLDEDKLWIEYKNNWE